MLLEALDSIATPRQRRQDVLALLRWLAWILLVISVAQPSIVAGSAVRPASGHAVVLAVDLSSSMERRDFVFEGAKVDRLIAFKSVARAFVEKRQGDRLALILFGDEAFSAAPLSYDVSSVANALEESAIGIAGRATAIGDAIGLAITKLRADPAPEKAIVLMSDGTNNAGSAEPEDAARLARSLGIRIHTIGLGSDRESNAGDPMSPAADLDEGTLKNIAEATGGRFFRARTTEELEAVYREVDKIERSSVDAPPIVPRTDIRNWFLLALVVTLALATALRARSVTS